MNDYEASLYDALLALETRDECERFLWDVLSDYEVSNLVTRWKALCALLEGSTQRKVAQEFGMSISTVSRAARVLRQGAGGCQLLFERVKGKNRGQKITESERSTVSGANRWRGF